MVVVNLIIILYFITTPCPDHCLIVCLQFQEVLVWYVLRREQMLAFHLRNAIISIFQKNVFKSVPYPNISKTPRSSEMWTSLNNVVALDRQQPILSESMLEKIHDRRTITKIQSATEGYKRNLSLHGSPWWTSYCVGSIHWFVCGMLVVLLLWCHSSQIQGLCSTKSSSKTLENLPYLIYTNTQSCFSVFHFVLLYIFP